SLTEQHFMSSKIHSVLSESAGRIKQWKKETTGITGETEASKFRVTFYNEKIARISLTKASDFETFSYAVVAQPETPSWDLEESELTLTLNTSALKLIVKRGSTSFRFETPDGKVINEDDEAFGTNWVGEQVTTYKKLQDKERFIGLGEKTGHLDRKGSGYVNWNTDQFGYGSGTDPLYSSIP